MVIVDKELALTPGLVRAAALARKSGDRLLLTLFESNRAVAHAASRGFDLDAYKHGRGEKLEALAERLRRDGLKVDTRLFWDDHPVIASILLAVLAEQPQMVIKDVHREAGLKRLLFTPTDLDLLRQCPVPLMLVRSGTHGLRRGGPMNSMRGFWVPPTAWQCSVMRSWMSRTHSNTSRHSRTHNLAGCRIWG
jgi:universal stress protein E